MRRRIVIALVLLAAYNTATAQAPSGKPSFEVVSVKQNVADGRSDSGSPRRSGATVVMHNTQVYSVIYYAYKLEGNYQMVGFKPLPDGWNWYDIEGRADASATEDQIRLMFQSLLEDRFHLKVHREHRDLPGFRLTTDKKKPKLRLTSESPMTLTIEGKSFTQRLGTCSTSGWLDGSHTVCSAATMATITSHLSTLLKSPLSDETGELGIYDVHLVYIPDDRQLQPDAPPGPTLATAVKEELGLKLERTKVRAEVLVVDHLEKPSPN